MDLTVARCTLFMLVTSFLFITTKGKGNSTINSTTNGTISYTTSSSSRSMPPINATSTKTSTSSGTSSIVSSTAYFPSKSQFPPSSSVTPTQTSKHSQYSTSPVVSSTSTVASSTSSSSSMVPPTSNGNNDETTVIILAVIAAIAAAVALVFLFLYLRTSRQCYDRLHRSSSHSSANFTSVNPIAAAAPIRIRLASLSSIRRQAICKSEPFPIGEFNDHVKRLHADSDYLFSLEYECVGGKKYLNEVDKKQELVSHEGGKVKNKAKNRYSDILPYDHTRIVLTEIEDDPDSIYINANYVDSYRKPQAYIAAQGPLTSSLEDFWRMIWENDVRVVVMVTNLFERTKPKCVQYWPNKGSANYGFLTVTILKEEMFAYYVVRTLSVEPSPNQVHYIKTSDKSKSRVIQQFHFTEWPDHDVPIHPVALLRFIKHSKSANSSESAPLVVHCSAGVGRSGVYMVIDSMIERIEDDKSVDVFNFLNHIRTQRIALVQEERQYVFVHDCIMEHINFGDAINIPIREFHKRLEALKAVNPVTKKSRMKEEYEDIDRIKHPDKHKWAGKKNSNVQKNRRTDLLPVERTRVKLPPILGIDGSDYINASYIDGFRRKREFIATQAPMLRTAECFYRMIYSTKCSIVVMIINDERWQKEDYADLPTEDEPVTCGKFEIQLESQDVVGKVTVRKLRLFSSEASDGHTIMHYHYRDWPSRGFPEDKTSFLNFIEQVREHRLAESCKLPITVHCDYGVGPTGVFCLISSLYDQIDREESVNVFHAAKLFRIQRPKLIETEEMYSFCYELLDQVIARKCISMSSYSDDDEPSSPSETLLENKNALLHTARDVDSNHSPEFNGSVVVDTSHADRKSPAADNEASEKAILDGNKLKTEERNITVTLA
ncbi:receptor-type tyrosine-protein phosphatase alpha-like isoform X2 [Dendronephthya gigantea]|uniref:receptor-type tyrosine-protein phosphatase alpha-like isoform X2 n=1 Tax=Dendronephthya gigantea TaxID=151771 RepID=UPI0010690EBD|nr:receptor-type tyrosine-protein phosphatase alpha-like isoform X2 [Dendronephthya gigantea]